MSLLIDLKEGCKADDHDKMGACYNCCDRCNYCEHRCYFCGTELQHNSYEVGNENSRHWLSDCRPDLIDGSYDDGVTVYKDGPMV